MGQLSVSGLDGRIIQALEQRAARSGRSVEAEHRALLEEVLGPESESFEDTAAQLRAQSPPRTADSADLLWAAREGRVDPTAKSPSRFRKALGTAGPGPKTDEIMQWLRPTRPQEVLGPESESFADAAARLRAQSLPQTTDSADLLRAMRYSRADPLVIERVVEIFETAGAALTSEQKRAVDAFLKEIGAG